MSIIKHYRKIAASTPFEEELTKNVTDDMTLGQISETVRSNGAGEFVEGICQGICDSALYIVISVD